MGTLITVVLCVFLLIYFGFMRNESVYLIKMHFLRAPGLFPIAYDTLPSYMEMVWSPRYQHLWTKAQWVKWVKAQGVEV